MAKRRKRRKLKIKNIIIFLLIIALIVLGTYYFLNLPIKNIYIRGNNIVDDNTIIEESEINNYPSFLLTSKYKIENKLENNKYIKKAIIKKKIGNVVEIIIKEYKPIAIMEEKVLLSNGTIIENTYNINDLPILINQINDNIFKNFIAKFNTVNESILRQISQIEYNPTNVDNSRFILYMNDSNIVYISLSKINKLNKYNQIKDKIGDKTGIIYLDSGNYIELKDNKVKES